MSERKFAILSVLDQTRQTLEEVLARLGPDDWEKPAQHGDMAWTVRQMLSHLVDAQRSMTLQIRRISVGEDIVPPDFDLNRWNRRAVEKAATKTPDELIAALRSDRETLKAALAELSDADLDKRGRHGSLEIMSIDEIIRLIGTHEAGHARDIATALWQ